MRKMDYHVHSIHSYDGNQTIEEMCLRMIELGVEEVCLTEHFDLGHPDPECQGIPAWDIWEQEIKYMRMKYPQISIKRGIEVGDNPLYREEIQQYVKNLNMDYVLLSLHLVNQNDPYYPDRFFKGQDRKKCYIDYLKAVDDEVRSYSDYDSVAHIGYIGRYAPWKDDEKPVRFSDAAEIVDDILECIIKKDKCLEINTKGICGQLIPDESIIRRYIEKGGNAFTFGSDAHETGSDYCRIEEAKMYVKSLGGKYQAGFTNRKRELYIL